jgi:gliding motility-associated-like protein
MGKNIFYFVVGCLLLVVLSVGVSNAQSPTTNYGKDFWYGYTPSSDLTSAIPTVYITSFNNTSGTISVPLGSWSSNFTVTPNAVTAITIPASQVIQPTGGFGSPANMGIHITSNDNISVFAAIEFTYRSESTAVLPVTILGNQYYVMNYKPLGFNFGSYGTFSFLIVAQDCKDSVEITPAKNLTIGGSHSAGVPFTVVLQSGQTFLVQSDSDLTGSMVRSLNNSETAVIAGSLFNSVGCSGTGNPFYEELFPVNTWGENFVFLATPHAYDQCRVLAQQNNTTVSFFTGSGTNVINLNAGQHYDTAINYTSPVYISSNNPISVAKFLRTAGSSGSCNMYYGSNPNQIGDPSEVMVDAIEQMHLDSVAFTADSLPDQRDSAYLEVITRTVDTNTVTLDGGHIGGIFATLGPNTTYSCAVKKIPFGPHKLLTTGQGLLAYYTNLAVWESASNDAGVYLKEISVSTATTLPSSCSASDGTATANASGIAPFTYLWSNGQTTQTATGLSAGTYTVTVSDEDCVPHWDTGVVVLQGEAGFTVSVTDTIPSCYQKGWVMANPTGGATPYSFSWSDGNTNQKDTGLVTGTYTCVVTDNNGCHYAVGATIVMDSALPIMVTPLIDSVCIGNSINVTASGPATSYTWLPSAGLSCTNCANPIATPTLNTTYTVTGMINSGCKGNASVNIKVNSLPVININPPKDTICLGSSANLSASGGSTYLWTPSTDLSCTTCASTVASPTIAITYSVTGTNVHGCSDTAKINLFVKPKPFPVITSVPANDSICYGDSAHLSGSGGTLYQWQPGSVLVNNFWAKPNNTTTYTLSVSNGGCTKDTTVQLEVTPLPVINITPSSTICVGDSITLSASGGGTYMWSNNSTKSSIKVSPTSATTYKVVVDKFCIDSATTQISVDAPGFTVCCNDTIIAGNSVNLTASGGSNYAWLPPTGLNCDNCSNPIASPTVTTTYTITYTDANNCSTQRNLTVNVEPACYDFTVPNVFTPNGDGVNDQMVINAAHLVSYNIIIYDRWGKQVFASSNPNDSWNGKIDGNGPQVHDGVYYYTITASCYEKNLVKKGFVQVLGDK